MYESEWPGVWDLRWELWSLLHRYHKTEFLTLFKETWVVL